jgi:DNA mismatch endonuclease (patch repair protein)
MDTKTKEQRSKNMQAIKCKGTKDEILLAHALWCKGYRYRKNNKTVFGKPDLTFKTYKIAIFIDSEFFHGKNWKTEKFKIKSNRDFWWSKIERNIERDIVVNNELGKEGWKILRFWSKEMRKDLSHCVEIIEKLLKEAEAKTGRKTVKKKAVTNL